MFSPTETKVIEILGRRKMTIAEITGEFFNDGKQPINPNSVVSSAVIRINRKCDYHRLDWFINGAGLGRGGRTVWKDKR